MNSVIDVIVKNCMNERLDHIVMQNKDYLSTTEQSDKALDRLCEVLKPEQQLLLDDYIVANNKTSALYASCAYRQGMKDIVSLMDSLR